ncbi:hypothetical protein AHiyo6_11190 [Arthrobacter sp. Hiyo6]|jgi:hypothetical protein|nr:hypothetical protein AHiyo6_11190 [Arthrobacter sp. Hiyo6]
MSCKIVRKIPPRPKESTPAGAAAHEVSRDRDAHAIRLKPPPDMLRT